MLPLRIACAARATILSATLVAPVAAQDSSTCICRPPHEHVPSEFELRSSGSLSFIQSRPTGAFQRNIGFGYGVDGAYLFRLDAGGAVSLRADVGGLGYGRESFRAPLSPTVGGRIQVDVTTSNYIVPMSIGLQLAWPTGPIRPYVNGGVGMQLFFTQSDVNGADETWNFANTTNQSDWTPAWVAGGGITVPVYEKSFTVSIDLGAQFFSGGHAQYLRPGSIQDLPDAQIRITPLESDTRMVLVRLGMRLSR